MEVKERMPPRPLQACLGKNVCQVSLPSCPGSVLSIKDCTVCAVGASSLLLLVLVRSLLPRYLIGQQQSRGFDADCEVTCA